MKSLIGDAYLVLVAMALYAQSIIEQASNPAGPIIPWLLESCPFRALMREDEMGS